MKGYTPAFFDELAIADGADPKTERNRCRDLMVEDGQIDRDSIEMFVDWAVRREYCPNVPPVEQLIDERFLRRAQERLAVGV